MLVPGSSTAPLTLYHELLLQGREPAVNDFCARYPEAEDLAERIGNITRLRFDRGAPTQRFSMDSFEVPAQIAGYRIISPLGIGGLGRVYLAEQLDPSWLVALQFLEPPQKDNLERLRRRVKMARTLQHPGLATLHKIGMEEGLVYIASEFVHGFSLQQLLEEARHRSTSWDPGWILEVLELVAGGTRSHRLAEVDGAIATIGSMMRQVADALGCIHALRAIHSELKPTNIMMTFDGHMKIVDMARTLLTQALPPPSHDGDEVVDVVNYAAPEQLRGAKKEIGPWSDCYSLGMILFEMLVGRRLEHAERDSPPRASSLGPEITRNLDMVLRRALSPEVRGRFSDGDAFAKALVPRQTLAVGDAPSRKTDHNEGTAVVALPYEHEPPPPASELFFQYFKKMRAKRESLSAGSVLVAAFCRGQKTKLAVLEPHGGEVGRVAILGRHSQAAFRLDGDPTIPLRQSVLITHWQDGVPTFRLLDLKTGRGFDVVGVGRCEAVKVTGYLIVRIGAYWMFFIPTTGLPWPKDPQKAWSRASNMLVKDLRDDAPRRAPDDFNPGEDTSDVVVLPSVASITTAASTQSEARKRLRGRLCIKRRSGSVTCPIFADELERGLLLGRYDRCDVGSSDLWEDDTVSRVHLLLSEAGAEVLAIDTASTNGTTIDGSSISTALLKPNSTLQLGDVEVTWDQAR